MVTTVCHNWLGHLKKRLVGVGTPVDSPQLSFALSRPTGFAVVDLYKCSATGSKTRATVAGSLPSGLETVYLLLARLKIIGIAADLHQSFP
jgi:hypothetical protein